MEQTLEEDRLSYSDKEWECSLFGLSDFKWHTNIPPNWFWRLMQYLILGNKWNKP